MLPRAKVVSGDHVLSVLRSALLFCLAVLHLHMRFGPAYLAVGATRASGTTVYVFLGPFW